MSSGNIEKWTMSCSLGYVQRNSACSPDSDFPSPKCSNRETQLGLAMTAEERGCLGDDVSCKS